jgi:hypothetical protein
VQLAGFSPAEALSLFGPIPSGYSLKLVPMSPAQAQARYVQRFEVLSDAAGFAPITSAFDSE